MQNLFGNGNYFNPPSPCGEGPYRGLWLHDDFHISIHPPRVGRDRWQGWQADRYFRISIHPPRVGRDVGKLDVNQAVTVFQSTLPVWGGTLSRCKK